eukprot:2148554-Ditylum_brightwellii.AAC.1
MSTQSKLKNEVDRGEWVAAEKAHLDSMEELHVYRKPIYAPKGANMLQPVWTYLIKHDGHKKARHGCNGSILKGKGIARMSYLFYMHFKDTQNQDHSENKTSAEYFKI